MIYATGQDQASTFTPTMAIKSPATPPDYLPPQSSGNAPLTPKKKSSWKMILGGLMLIVLVAGGVAGNWLLQQNQDIRQQAAGQPYDEPGESCPTAGATSCMPNGVKLVCENYTWKQSGKCNAEKVECWGLSTCTSVGEFEGSCPNGTYSSQDACKKATGGGANNGDASGTVTCGTGGGCKGYVPL